MRGVTEMTVTSRTDTPSAAAFRAERLRRGLSQRACAEALGVVRATIERWEYGQTRIPYAAWRLLLTLPPARPGLSPGWPGQARASRRGEPGRAGGRTV